MNPTKIIIHHSLTKDDKTVSWDSIRRYHLIDCGWKDIGYHYGIELVNDHYEIFKGRMDNEEGAHCRGFNEDSIGICVVGNYDLIPPSIMQMDMLRHLVISLMEIYGIKQENVLGHRETYALLGVAQEKSCPGNAFNMVEFRHTLI